MSLVFLGAYFWIPDVGRGERRSARESVAAGPAAHHSSFQGFFQPLLNHEKYNLLERAGLITVLIIALIGLAYALMLRSQVLAAPEGTKKMQEIAEAVREGANAYLGAQFRKIGPLIILITIALFFTKYRSHW